jgi:flagellar hook assembly protein FlgD
MNNATRFTFEHNQPGNPLDVSIRIYTLSGKPVQQIKQSLITTSSYASISWDGRDRDYDRLGNGTYIYVLRVATDTPKGRQATEQIEKLVIIR